MHYTSHKTTTPADARRPCPALHTFPLCCCCQQLLRQHAFPLHSRHNPTLLQLLLQGFNAAAAPPDWSGLEPAFRSALLRLHFSDNLLRPLPEGTHTAAAAAAKCCPLLLLRACSSTSSSSSWSSNSAVLWQSMYMQDCAGSDALAVPVCAASNRCGCLLCRCCCPCRQHF